MRFPTQTAAILVILSTVSVARSEVRVVHASPDAPNVDVIVNDNFGSPAFSDLPYTGVTDYAYLPSSTYNFKVVPTGFTDPIVINADVPIDASKDYTIGATNVLSDITPIPFVDDNTLVSDMARIRFLHLSPNAPTVDVQVAGGGTVLFNDVSFQESGGYVSVPGGTYDLEVVLSEGGGLALELPGIAVENNRVYTAYAMGLVGDALTPLQAVISVDAVPEPNSLGMLMISLLGLFAVRRRV